MELTANVCGILNRVARDADDDVAGDEARVGCVGAGFDRAPSYALLDAEVLGELIFDGFHLDAEGAIADHRYGAGEVKAGSGRSEAELLDDLAGGWPAATLHDDIDLALFSVAPHFQLNGPSVGSLTHEPGEMLGAQHLLIAEVRNYVPAL